MFIILFFIASYQYGLCSIIFSRADINSILSNYSIQSTYISTLHSKRHVWNSSVCHYLKLKLAYVEYNFCIKALKLSYPGLINETTPVFLPHSNSSVTIDDLMLKMANGYAMDFEDLSFVKGYIHQDRFYGTIQVMSSVYYVEPATHFDVASADPKSDGAIIYQKPNSSIFDEINGTFKFAFEIFNVDMAANIGRPQKVNGKTCLSTLVIDNSFVQAVGNGSADHAIQRLLQNFDEVNAILRSADFDNDRIPDNVGISIGMIATMDSPSPHLGSISRTPIDQPVNPIEILQKFAMITLARLACLNILVIGHPFIDHFLGVSFTATKNIFDRFKHVGICAGNSIFIPSLNALVVTYRFANGDMLPKPLIDVNLVHEISHSFGSDHDAGNCLKGYIMSPKTAIPSRLINFQFSPCSKRDISAVLRKQGDCLLEYAKPFCGNGIVEYGEQCDCGSSYHCAINDPCCYPRDSLNQCKVNRRIHQCHPAEDFCCTSACTYKDLTHIGLDCSNIQNRCPCSNKDCTCGISGTCIGSECHSFECTRIGLVECQCPIASQPYCETCCMDSDGICLKSQVIAARLITSNPNFTLTSDVSFVNVRSEIVETICNDNNCFTLNFHRFRSNDFCTYHGKVGICLKSRCMLPSYVPNRLPVIQKSVRSNSSKLSICSKL
ncbi:hypothetical protein AMK59_7473, partial [Oryctes borbonicus]